MFTTLFAEPTKIAPFATIGIERAMLVQSEDTNSRTHSKASLDLTKPVCCRSGRKVRIFMTDAGGDYPIIGAIWEEHDGFWDAITWMANGSYAHPGYPHLSRFDLVNCEEVPT